MPRMITLREAAKETGLSYGCLRKLCLSGQIAHIRAGSKFLLNYELLAEYLNTSGITQSGGADGRLD